jgi:hypothetical protein
VLTNINDETEHGVPPAIRAARLRRASDAIRSPAGNGAGTVKGTVVAPSCPPTSQRVGRGKLRRSGPCQTR